MRPIDKARIIAKEYISNCAELSVLLAERDRPVTPTDIPVRSGRISKPVEAAVLGKMEAERIVTLRRAVHAVEYALEKIAYKNEGYKTKQIVEMVYFKKSHKLYGAAAILEISYETAKLYNKYFLKMIAIAMGDIPFEV